MASSKEDWTDLSAWNFLKRSECKKVEAAHDRSTAEAEQQYIDCMNFLYPESGFISPLPFLIILIIVTGIFIFVKHRFYKKTANRITRPHGPR